MKTKSLVEVEKHVNKELDIIDIAELKEGKNEKREPKSFFKVRKNV